MWSDKYDPAREGKPLPPDPYAEVPPGRPPWVPAPEGLTWAGWAFLGLLGAAGVSLLVSAVVVGWRFVDNVTDLR